MNGKEIGLNDKRGNPIHYGDLLQIGLGISDRQHKLVVLHEGKPYLVNESDSDSFSGGFKLTASQSKFCVILDHDHS